MNIKQTLAITQKGQQKENHEIQHTILKTMKGNNNPVEIRQRKSREKSVKKQNADNLPLFNDPGCGLPTGNVYPLASWAPNNHLGAGTLLHQRSAASCLIHHQA